MSAEAPSFDSVLEIYEVFAVFSIDLLGLTPELDVDFAINLEPGTKRIYIYLYRLAIIELKELCVLLHGLLDHEFI